MDNVGLLSQRQKSKDSGIWERMVAAVMGRKLLPHEKKAGGTQKWPVFILWISVAETLIMFYAIIYNGGFVPFSENIWAGPSVDTIIIFGAKDVTVIRNENQWWRFLSPVFLHLGVFHLLSNLFAQLFVGIMLERLYHSWRIAFTYIVSGIAGNLLSAIFLPKQVEAGASPALFGLLSIYLVDLISNWKMYKAPKQELAKWIITTAITLVLGVLPFIDNFAHIGGSLGGFLAVMIVVPSNGISPTKIKVLRTVGVISSLIFFGVGFTLFYTNEDVANDCDWCKYLSCIPAWGWCDTLK
eukprot:TRINITY_DN8499_c0_g1_i1.p1 TRINITY_DN8499_c0_g1~~TRINITY_DN8499_c0_g1_i1.p1  ORF type:complete len:298 (-),score=35.30 TRINITY_DN8499_c0_g1_i1:98-991(-)